MSFEVKQRGTTFFVFDSAKNQVVDRFQDKAKATERAKQLASEQHDYYKDVKSNISIKSVDMNL